MSKGKVRKVFRGAAQWKAILARYEESGLSQECFCAEQGLALSTFCNWRSRLRADGGSGEKEPPFIELVAPLRDRPWDMELDLGGGVVLRMRRG